MIVFFPLDRIVENESHSLAVQEDHLKGDLCLVPVVIMCIRVWAELECQLGNDVVGGDVQSVHKFRSSPTNIRISESIIG